MCSRKDKTENFARELEVVFKKQNKMEIINCKAQ